MHPVSRRPGVDGQNGQPGDRDSRLTPDRPQHREQTETKKVDHGDFVRDYLLRVLFVSIWAMYMRKANNKNNEG